MELMILLVVVGTSLWVLSDATRIGVRKGVIKGSADLGPGGWFAVCLMLWIVGFPWYLSIRSKFIEHPQTAPQRRAPSQAIRLERKSEINFRCEHCRQELKADPDMAGELFDCPACQKTIEVPAR